MSGRLQRIRPAGDGLSVEFVVCDDAGREEALRADLAGLVALTPVLEPLMDPAVFETVHPIDDGAAAAWDAPDAEVSADLLAMIAREQTPMDAAAFKAVQARLGLTNEKMGAALGITDRTIKNYRSGRSDVPAVVRFVLRRFLEDKKLLVAHLAPSRPAGRPRKTGARGYRARSKATADLHGALKEERSPYTPADDGNGSRK